ncbi:MAG: hypothetical protein ACR5LA_07050 [Wolbachia sp.]
MIMEKWIPVSGTGMTEEEKVKFCLLLSIHYTYSIRSSLIKCIKY